MSFNDKVVVVTGASSGIGASIAERFSAEGAKVSLIGRNAKKLKDVADVCEKNGNKPLVIVADVTKDNDIKKIVNDTINHFGKLDVLVNNAGIGFSVSIQAENAMQMFDKVFQTNFRSAVYLTNLSVPHLIKTKGNIINISSVASTAVISRNSFSYCASKAALDHFTRSIALELAPEGVRVNVVNPGPVKTDILENMGASDQHQQAIWDMMIKNTALERISDPVEIADLVLYLASDKARSITGSSFVTDNGALLMGTMDV